MESLSTYLSRAASMTLAEEKFILVSNKEDGKCRVLNKEKRKAWI